VTIWIDPPAWPAHGRLWSHLVSDTSYDELHDFAAAQRVPRRSFEGDHYDVPQERHAALVAAGARLVGGRELARILRDSGLRIPKRRHERVVRSVPNAAWLPAGGRADVIASRQDDAPATTVVVRLALLRGGDLLAVERPDGNGLDLPTAAVGDDGPLAALAKLYAALLGSAPTVPPRLLGYVRNTVTSPVDDYPWPAPRACFAVYLERLRLADEAGMGSWVAVAEAGSLLSQRHWWPLLAELPSDHV
jgi:hypothetical protein